MDSFLILTGRHAYWIYRDWIGGRERGRKTLIKEGNIDWLPLAYALTGDRTHTLGMWPDRESNLQPFSLWAHAPTESHRPGLDSLLYLLHPLYEVSIIITPSLFVKWRKCSMWMLRMLIPKVTLLGGVVLEPSLVRILWFCLSVSSDGWDIRNDLA